MHSFALDNGGKCHSLIDSQTLFIESIYKVRGEMQGKVTDEFIEYILGRIGTGKDIGIREEKPLCRVCPCKKIVVGERSLRGGDKFFGVRLSNCGKCRAGNIHHRA